MNLFIDRHQELLSVLLKYKVDFIIVGGYSVIYHGYKRTTGDVDIWLKPDNENKAKLVAALREFDIDESGLELISKLDFTNIHIFHLWEEPEKVDFMTRINMVKYEDADKHKIIAIVDDLKIPFLHLNDLVLSKINTDRQKDKADIEELQKLNKSNPKK